MKPGYLLGLAAVAKSVLASDQQPLRAARLLEAGSDPGLDEIITSSPLLSFHRDIVEIASVTENEKDVGDFVLEFLAAQNLTVEKQIVSPETKEQKGRFNVYACAGENRYPEVLLTSHIDTVPPFIPYSLHSPQSDGSSFDRQNLVIAGRGTVDAKASVAAIVFAVLETLRDNPDAAIGLLFDVGEERDGVGMKHFSNSDLNLEPPTYRSIIFGEPTESSLVAGHKGSMKFTLVSRGKAAHSGYPWLGASAISTMLPVLSHLDSLPNVLPQDGGLPRSERLGQSTLNIGQISGGVAANVIPAYAEATISVRIAEGSPEDIKDIVRKALSRMSGGVQDIDLDFGNPTTGTGPQYFDVDVDGFDVITVNYGTDAASLHIHDQCSQKVRRYLYGPGSIHVAHADNEAITVGELEEAVQGYKRLISASL
ncbi:Peptidase M20 [Penicillium maclennaniae]|uniref:Peptidase M20 n=1 Tax=Penicillium maclennaniae TaxID=1343394 RepID=UPI00253FEF0F|nr:Peptidase M20 [Penicillium maclennaniae]KAJ5681505.1 Peptidase M20 [Penicillium maclennaniae]